MRPLVRLAALLLASALAGCTATSTAVNLGTWKRRIETVGYCMNDDGGGVALVEVRKSRAIQEGPLMLDLLELPRGLEFRAVVAFTREDALATRSAQRYGEYTLVLNEGDVLAASPFVTAAFSGDGPWRLYREGEPGAPAACARGDANFHEWGAPMRVEDRVVRLRPDFWIPDGDRRVTRPWRYPALALVPLGLLLDAVTFPLQAYLILKSLESWT